MNRHSLIVSILVLLATSAFSQTLHVIDPAWTNRGTQVLDLDQDGDLDVLSDPFYGTQATMWLNNGWQEFERV